MNWYFQKRHAYDQNQLLNRTRRTSLPRRLVLPFILLIAFVVRLSLLPTAEKMHFNYIADSRMYADKAMLIMEGKQLERVWHQGPLYPYFLAGICSAAGRKSMYPVLFVQMLLGLCSIFLVYAITMRVSGSWVAACIASFLLALYQPMIFYEEMILMESLLTFLYLAFLGTIIMAEMGGKKRMWFTAGLILGIAALGRGSILLFALFYLGFKAIQGIKISSSEGKKAVYIRLALFVAGTVLTVSPLTIRNFIVGRDFVPLAANYGITFYEGNNRFAKGIYMDPPGLNLDQDFTGEKIASFITKRPLKPSEVSRFWMGEAWKDIKQAPFRFVWLLGLKTAYYWNMAEIPNAESYTFAKKHTPFYSIPLIGFPIAGIFGLLGIALAWRRRRKSAAVLLLFVAAHMVSVAMFFIAARYRISVVPVLLIFASMAIVYAVDLFRKKQNKKLAMSGVAAGCAALFVFFPWQGISNQNIIASTYNNMGLFYSANNNVDVARKYYESTIHECPGFWKPYNNLGNLYLARGEKEKALSCYLQGLQKGVPYDSCAMFIHMSLGTYYLKEGNIEEARKHYAQASPYVPYSLMMRQLSNELKL
jgi:4-amino-4-deoxy-L-arabinose transferase-like glycosyltransferase